MIFNEGYHNLMDRGFMEASDSLEAPIEAPPPITNMGPHDVGISANPFQHPLQALQARIREGAKKVELTFFGMGKGNRERFTPESIGKAEREDIRALGKLNEIQTTVHATPAFAGVSGLTREGFNEQQRETNLKEIRKAIDFSAEATSGGAVVVHTGEWDRPVFDAGGKEDKGLFKAYEEEPNKAPIMVVDEQTGQINAIRRDYTVYEPEYKTAKSEKITVDANGKKLRPDDWIDKDNKWIDPNDTDRLFERVPEWDETHTNFKTKQVTMEEFEKRAKKQKELYGKDIKPQVLFFQTQLQNQALTAMGSSLFHAQRYDEYKHAREKLQEAIDFYKKIDENMNEEDKKKLLVDRLPAISGLSGNYVTRDKESVLEMLEREKKSTEDSMRHIHESSAMADTQAQQYKDQIARMKTMEEYGLDKSADSLAKMGLMAYRKTQEQKKHLKEDIYISPENWDPNQYASHPDEMIKLVNESRNKLATMLSKHHNMELDQAKKIAKNHVKATLDSGHMNLWRQHFIRKDGESEKSFDKRYRKWYTGKVQKMADAGIVGHVHLTDNFGYDDEHLTIGQGNTPHKEFIKIMEGAGIKDMIIEPGSFNATTAMSETLQWLGSPVYSLGRGTPGQERWGSFHQQGSGLGAPPFYMVGAYSPSSDFRFWSEVPLE